jgi:hypothetical protein
LIFTGKKSYLSLTHSKHAMQSASASTASTDIRIPFWKCNDCNVHWQAISDGCASCGKTGFRLSLRRFEREGLIDAVALIKDVSSREEAVEAFEELVNRYADWISYYRSLIQAAWFAIGGDNPSNHPKITFALECLKRMYDEAPDAFHEWDAYRYTPEEHASNVYEPTRTIDKMVERSETLFERQNTGFPDVMQQLTEMNTLYQIARKNKKPSGASLLTMIKRKWN